MKTARVNRLGKFLIITHVRVESVSLVALLATADPEALAKLPGGRGLTANFPLLVCVWSASSSVMSAQDSELEKPASVLDDSSPDSSWFLQKYRESAYLTEESVLHLHRFCDTASLD